MAILLRNDRIWTASFRKRSVNHGRSPAAQVPSTFPLRPSDYG
jgi:hypothetical protein